MGFRTVQLRVSDEDEALFKEVMESTGYRNEYVFRKSPEVAQVIRMSMGRILVIGHDFNVILRPKKDES